MFCKKMSSGFLIFSLTLAFILSLWASAGAQTKPVRLARATVGSSLPFHPGAAKYLQEKGVKIK
jgi:TRAP-type uncharacterized transport system substrate-binding protein